MCAVSVHTPGAAKFEMSLNGEVRGDSQVGACLGHNFKQPGCQSTCMDRTRRGIHYLVPSLCDVKVICGPAAGCRSGERGLGGEVPNTSPSHCSHLAFCDRLLELLLSLVSSVFLTWCRFLHCCSHLVLSCCRLLDTMHPLVSPVFFT